MRDDNNEFPLFQFHLVRLKAGRDLKRKQTDLVFQFHLVRLKVKKETRRACLSQNFNSI